MKRYFKSGYNYIQDMVLEPGTYTFWARILSNFGDTFTFALANEAGEWEVFDVDVEMGQWSKVYEVFNITEKKVKLDLIHRYYDSEQPVFVFKPQLIKGNIPTDAGASPYDIDQITDDLHDSINGIADFTNEEFADRVLSASERISLKRDMEAVETIFQSLKGSYEKLIINPFVSVAVTTDLTTKYNAVTSAKTELFNVLNLIIAGDNIVTPEEVTAKDAALLALNTALYNYNLAEKEIQNALGADYTQKISAIRDFTDNEFADRMISETEKISLSHDLDSVQTLVDSVTSRFNEMLLNPFLTEADRNLLIEKYNALLDAWDWDESIDPAKQNGLKTVILNIINDPDDLIDPAEMLEKDAALSSFNIALGEFSETEVYVSKITIDYAIEQATFWSIHATSPVIYKDAKDAVTDGHHMPVTVKGQLHRGTQIQDGGYLTVTADDAAEAAEATASPVLIEPEDYDDKSLYTIRLYDSAAKTILLDTMTIPVVFRGANGKDAINITLSNEIDSVPASNEGVVSSYDNTGTDIRVFEGVTELTYDGSGASPGTFKVTSLGIDLTVGQISSPTVGVLKCVVGNISNLITDKGITQFTITGKTLGNESFSEVREQRITKGKMGAPGDQGEPGAGILSVVDWYAISTDGINPPGTGWQTTLPAKPANYYLWNYEVITYTDGRTPTQTEKRVIQGKDARSIYDIKNAYAYSASDTVSPTSGWQYSIAALGTKPTGYFLWVRDDIAYTDNPSNYIGTIGYVVRDGEDGKDAVDIRLTATNTQAVIGTNGVTPTEIIVTGTAKNTTISGWSYSVDGGSFTTPPNGVTRAGNVVTINTAVAIWRTLAIKAYNTTDSVDSVITISIVGYGAAGEKGKVPIVKEWLNSDTHLNNENVVDYIYYRPTRTWWKLKDEYTSRLATSSPSTTYYEQIPYMDALAAKVLIAEEANLANFVFKDGKLLSIAGTVSGVPATYSGQAGFVHNIVLDGITGEIIAVNANISGTIHATTGELGELTLMSGGFIDLPPSFTTSIVGRIDSSGIRLVYDGNYSQSINWYTGLGTFAGEITPDSNGHLNLYSSFGLKLESDGNISIGTDGISGNIKIGNALKPVDFGGATVSNIKKITSLGFPVFAYSTVSMSPNTNYTINTDTPLLVITSAGADAGILKINKDAAGNSPDTGMMKIICNATNTGIRFKCTTTGSNIRYGEVNAEYILHGNALAVLIYYSGYWRIHVDRGQ